MQRTVELMLLDILALIVCKIDKDTHF